MTSKLQQIITSLFSIIPALLAVMCLSTAANAQASVGISDVTTTDANHVVKVTSKFDIPSENTGHLHYRLLDAQGEEKGRQSGGGEGGLSGEDEKTTEVKFTNGGTPTGVETGDKIEARIDVYDENGDYSYTAVATVTLG